MWSFSEATPVWDVTARRTYHLLVSDERDSRKDSGKSPPQNAEQIFLWFAQQSVPNRTYTKKTVTAWHSDHVMVSRSTRFRLWYWGKNFTACRTAHFLVPRQTYSGESISSEYLHYSSIIAWKSIPKWNRTNASSRIIGQSCSGFSLPADSRNEIGQMHHRGS